MHTLKCLDMSNAFKNANSDSEIAKTNQTTKATKMDRRLWRMIAHILKEHATEKM